MKLFITLFLLCIYIPSLLSQVYLPNNMTIEEKLVDYYKKLPQEKIYLHTDKSHYAAGDSLWFRAYLVNALTNVASIESRYLYIELRDLEKNTLIERTMVKCDSTGVFSNALSLSFRLPEGEYTLSAYTQWMRNFESEQFFSKKIQIVNPFVQRTVDSIPPHKLDNLDFRLMPEGGNLLTGISQRVAFKAMDNNGHGVDVNVQVVREGGEVVQQTSSLHKGMGYFPIIPSTNELLYVEAYTRDGSSKRVMMPAPLTTGVSLSVSQFRNHLQIQPLLTQDVDINRLALVIHGGQNIVVFEEIKSSNPLIRIPLPSLFEGVATIALIDKHQHEVLSERLVYIRGDGAISPSVQIAGKMHTKRSPVSLTLEVKDEEGNPLPGRYSLAVADAKNVSTDSAQANIESYLLLSSDIKGCVEDPNYYFRKVTPSVDAALDLLMITQNWHRYNLSAMLNSKYPEIDHPFQRHQSISGEVRKASLWSNKLKDSQIKLMIPNEGYIQTYSLGDSARFHISNIAFVDGTAFTLEATDKKGSPTFMQLKIDTLTFPEFRPTVLRTKQNKKTDVADRPYTSPKEKASHYAKNSEEIELPDIEVTAKKIAPPILNKYKVTPYRSFNEDDHALQYTSTMTSLLSRLGVKILFNEDGYSFPGMLFIDNFKEDDKQMLWNIPPTDVKQIEYIKGNGNSEAMVFGHDAVLSGAVLVFLKDGGEALNKPRIPSEAMKHITPMGYRPPVEFYSPRYQAPSEISHLIPDLRTTLFWSPEIILDDSGTATVEFYTTDDPGELHITIEGISNSGRIINFVQ